MLSLSLSLSISISISISRSLDVAVACFDHSERVASAVAASSVAAPPRAPAADVLPARAQARRRRQGTVPNRHLHVRIGKVGSAVLLAPPAPLLCGVSIWLAEVGFDGGSGAASLIVTCSFAIQEGGLEGCRADRK